MLARGRAEGKTSKSEGMKRIGSNTVLWLLTLLLLGCMDGFEPSLIETPRILALRAEPTDGEPDDEAFTLEALTHQVEALTWTACVVPWVPTEIGVECPALSFELPSDNGPLSASLRLSSYPIPDEYETFLTALYVLAESPTTDVPPAVLRVDLGSPPNNPPLVGVSLDGQSPTDWENNDEDTVEVAPIWGDDSSGEGTTTSFFTSRGAFSPWRVLDGGPSSLSLEDGEGSTILYVITRYLGEGTSWVRLELGP